MHKQLSPLVKMDFLLKIPKIKNKNQVKCPKAGQKWLGLDKWVKAGLGRTNRPKLDAQPRAGQVAALFFPKLDKKMEKSFNIISCLCSRKNEHQLSPMFNENWNSKFWWNIITFLPMSANFQWKLLTLGAVVATTISIEGQQSLGAIMLLLVIEIFIIIKTVTL